MNLTYLRLHPSGHKSRSLLRIMVQGVIHMMRVLRYLMSLNLTNNTYHGGLEKDINPWEYIGWIDKKKL